MRLFSALFLLVAVAGLAFGFWRYQRPLPVLAGEAVIQNPPDAQKVKLAWPSYGQAAVGAVGYGVLDSHDVKGPVPIASIAKVITALSILKEKPLSSGQPGPTITLTAADAKLYHDYLAKDGSVVPVAAGQRISEYQALQAMMLPSANNIADTMAKWVFGSVSEYTDYANQFAVKLGMTQTTVADASGFSPKTVSTAKDLVILGEAALKNPVLAEIVGQSEAQFPGVGTIHNVNYLLGTNGIIGIKTGNTDQAGGCYLFGAKHIIDGQPVTIVGAVLGAQQRVLAMQDSRKLISSASSGFQTQTVLHSGQLAGRYKVPWGGSVEAVSTSEIKQLTWIGQTAVLDTNLKQIQPPMNQGADVGSVKTVSGHEKSAAVVLKQSVGSPPWTWRIFH